MNLSKKGLSQAILLALEKSVDGYVRLEDFTYNSHIYARGYDRPLHKSALSQALKRLREKGFIEKQVDAERVIIQLTEVGKEYLLENGFVEEEWDGIWRVVIFDIPEEKKRVRNVLRRRLKLWGFQMWQQSVWVTQKDVSKKLWELVKELGIEDWVAVFETKDVFSKNKIFNGRSLF